MITTSKQLSLIYYYQRHNSHDVIELIFCRFQNLLLNEIENNLLQVLVSRFPCIGLSSRLEFARTYRSILWYTFNILSCLSHISFRVGLKIKFTMPYIFIDSQINYAVDIQASLVHHEHSRLSQSILPQKYFFSTSSRCFEIRSLTRKTHLYLQIPGFVYDFLCVVTLTK
jgi:hypothetical protein